MSLHLSPITRNNCIICKEWRNGYREALRTPILLTDNMQDDFFEKVSRDRKSEDRYWEIKRDQGFPDFIGLGGLTSWEPENRIAEISLFLDPKLHRKGYGTQAVGLLCDEGFNKMNLKTIYGEAFLCNPGNKFWLALTEKMKGYWTFLPARKYWDGRYYDSIYFSWDVDNWRDRCIVFSVEAK